MAAVGIVAALLVLRIWLNVSAGGARRPALITAAIMMVVLLAFAVVGVKFFDLSGRREERAARIQDRIARRLREGLTGLSLTVVAAYASPSPRAPLVVEVVGEVPTPAVRARVLSLAREEAARLGRHVRVADRLEISSIADRPAA